MPSADNACDAGSSARALVWWWNADTQSEWKFCAHHNAEHEPRMLGTGHRIARDDRADLLPPVRAHVPADTIEGGCG